MPGRIDISGLHLTTPATPPPHPPTLCTPPHTSWRPAASPEPATDLLSYLYLATSTLHTLHPGSSCRKHKTLHAPCLSTHRLISIPRPISSSLSPSLPRSIPSFHSSILPSPHHRLGRAKIAVMVSVAQSHARRALLTVNLRPGQQQRSSPVADRDGTPPRCDAHRRPSVLNAAVHGPTLRKPHR